MQLSTFLTLHIFLISAYCFYLSFVCFFLLFSSLPFKNDFLSIAGEGISFFTVLAEHP